MYFVYTYLNYSEYRLSRNNKRMVATVLVNNNYMELLYLVNSFESSQYIYDLTPFYMEKKVIFKKLIILIIL